MANNDRGEWITRYRLVAIDEEGYHFAKGIEQPLGVFDSQSDCRAEASYMGLTFVRAEPVEARATYQHDRQSIERRDTHKYVGTYQHEDRWTTLGAGKVLGRARVLREPDGDADMSEGPLYGFTFVADRATFERHGPEAIRRALQDMFTRWGCAHDYDCCGCASTSARVRHTKRREFFVAQSVTYNY